MGAVKLYNNIIVAAGGATDASDNTKTALLKRILTACGGDPAELQDNLKTTILRAIAKQLGADETLDENDHNENVLWRRIAVACGVDENVLADNLKSTMIVSVGDAVANREPIEFYGVDDNGNLILLGAYSANIGQDGLYIDCEQEV